MAHQWATRPVCPNPIEGGPKQLQAVHAFNHVYHVIVSSGLSFLFITRVPGMIELVEVELPASINAVKHIIIMIITNGLGEVCGPYECKSL